ncbi:hypothetical protein QL285_046262 [Trifolium repens]|nr:hypothetical protein QL285_046262 [Trifolium repens]
MVEHSVELKQKIDEADISKDVDVAPDITQAIDVAPEIAQPNVVEPSIDQPNVSVRDVNGAGIDRRILYHPLPHHLKYSPSPFPFPASGRILPLSPSPRIHTVLADIHQL